MVESNQVPQISNTVIERESKRFPLVQRREFRDRVALAAVVILLLTNGFAGSQYAQRLRIHTDLVKASYKILRNRSRLTALNGYS